MLSTTMMLLLITGLFAQKNQKRSILVICGADIGYSNISINSHGMIGYKTPNIDQGGHRIAVRYNNWKLHFTYMKGAINEAFRKTPAWPLVINLRADSYEVSWKAAMYTRWYAENMWLFVPVQAYFGDFLQTFKEFPPVMGSSLSVDNVLKSLQTKPQN